MMGYPKKIVPKVSWRKGIAGDEILATNEEAIIGHRIEMSKESAISGEALSADAIPQKRMLGLSTCLLGGYFELAHFGYSQHEAGDADWNEGENVPEEIIAEPNYKSLNNDYFVIGWELKEIENLSLPYNRTFQKRKDYLAAGIYIQEYEKLPDDEKGQGKVVGCSGRMSITHNPVMLNYWHFVIDLYPEGAKEPLKNAKSAWQITLVAQMADIIRHTFLIIPDDIEPVPFENVEAFITRTA